VNVFETNFWNTHLRLANSKVINAILVRSLGWDHLNNARDAFVGRVGRVRRAISDMGWNTWSLASAVLDRTAKKVFVDTARDHQRPKYLTTLPLIDVRSDPSDPGSTPPAVTWVSAGPDFGPSRQSA
jgi:hypothetical protein